MKKNRRIFKILIALLTWSFFIGCSQNPLAPQRVAGNEDGGDQEAAAPLLEENAQYALMGGDMILDKANEDHRRIIEDFTHPGLAKSQGLYMATVSQWPNATVPYKLVGFTASEQQVILSAMKDIENNCGVTFTPSNASGNSYVYVITKVYGQSYGGVSTLGYGYSSYCNLNDTVIKGTTLHEFLHCLGICHEHQRADRDNFVTVNLTNVANAYKSQFTKMPKTIKVGKTNQNYGMTLGTYDFASIMHYPAWAFSKNGKNTIVPKKGDKNATMALMGQRTGLSATDITSLQAIYGM